MTFTFIIEVTKHKKAEPMMELREGCSSR